jgi:hypothetical protein
MKLYIFLFLLIFTVNSQTLSKHNVNIGLLNQHSLLSLHYEQFIYKNIRASIGFASEFSTYKINKAGNSVPEFHDYPVLLSFNYHFGKLRNYHIGFGNIHSLEENNGTFNFLFGYGNYIQSKILYRFSLNLTFDKEFYKRGASEMNLRGLFAFSINLGYNL